jgi:hypothetical protein
MSPRASVQRSFLGMNGLCRRFSGLTGKLVLVAAGYVGAALVAIAASAVWQAIFRPGGRGSGGMAAFGDSILFLWMLGILSVPATAAALLPAPLSTFLAIGNDCGANHLHRGDRRPGGHAHFV